MRVGILSASPSGLNYSDNKRLAEEILDRGAEPVLINFRRTLVAVREYGRQLLEVSLDGSLQEVKVDVVIPRINKYVEAGVKAIDTLTSNGVPSTVTSSGVILAKNKLATMVELDKNGIPVPYTIAPTGDTPEKTKEMIKLIQPEKKSPIIIKTLRGSKGKGVNIAESHRSANAQVQTLGSEGVEYLVQEYIEPLEGTGGPSDIRIIVVDGLIVASMKRLANPNANDFDKDDDNEFRANIALGASAISYDPTLREREMALRSAEVIGARVIGFDAMHSQRGPLVTELNVNPGFAIEQYTGANVAGAIVDLAIRLAEQKHNV